MTGHLVSWEAPSGRWRYENGPDQDSRSAGIGDEAVPVRVQAEGCRMKIGPNRKSRVRMARVLRTGLYVAYALPRLQGLYDAVNIKIDKCGGFTEALALANEARRLRFEIMGQHVRHVARHGSGLSRRAGRSMGGPRRAAPAIGRSRSRNEVRGRDCQPPVCRALGLTESRLEKRHVLHRSHRRVLP